MKTITIDYALYEEELRDEFQTGFSAALDKVARCLDSDVSLEDCFATGLASNIEGRPTEYQRIIRSIKMREEIAKGRKDATITP